MKKTLTGMLALLAGACAVHAQGTVSFANYLGLPTYIYVSFKPLTGASTLLGGAAQGATAPTMTDWLSELHYGADWTAELYGAPGNNASQSSMVPLTTGLNAGPFVTAAFASPGGSLGDTTAGTWNTAAGGTISGAAGNGSAASLQVAAWYNDGGVITTLAAAQADGVPWGLSTIVNTTTGGPAVTGPSGTATGLPATLGNFNVTTATPEPSTIALGIIGASTFLMRLRRKQ
jgi:hypothetical protein